MKGRNCGFARRGMDVPGWATRKSGPTEEAPGRLKTIRPRPEREEVVANYHFLGIVHDIFGIVAYALAICYYVLKLADLRRKQNDRQG